MMKRWNFIAIALCTVLAFVLRWAGSCRELWLDEIWSLDLVAEAASPLAIFFELRHDNNHILNSLCLFLLGSDQPGWLYRLPAVLAGAASVPAAAWAVGFRRPAEQQLAAFAVAVSYLLVHYSSEARGYSFCVLFALLAYRGLSQFLACPARRWKLLFIVSTLLGFTAHLSFLYFYAASLLWTVFAKPSPAADGRSRLTRLLQLHTVPLCGAAALYWTTYRGMELGGGPPYSPVSILVQVGSLGLGGPTAGLGAGIVCSLTLLGIIAGIVKLHRDNRDEWKLCAALILLPVVYLAVVQPPFMFVRYFLIATTFSLLLCCHALSDLLNWPKIGSAVVFVLAVAFSAANFVHFLNLATIGRGQYVAALHLMASASPAERLTISGDHDHGLRKLVEHHGSHLPSRQFVYCDADNWPAQGVHWLVLHAANGANREIQDEYTIHGLRYRHVKSFDTAILSGWQWHCYQRL